MSLFMGLFVLFTYEENIKGIGTAPTGSGDEGNEITHFLLTYDQHICYEVKTLCLLYNLEERL